MPGSKTESKALLAYLTRHVPGNTTELTVTLSLQAELADTMVFTGDIHVLLS